MMTGCCPLGNLITAPAKWSLPAPYEVRHVYDERTQSIVRVRNPDTNQLEKRVCIFNTKTRKAFRGYDPFLISVLSGIIALVTPFIAVAKMCWCVAQTVVFIKNDVIDVIKNIGNLFKKGTNKCLALREIGTNLINIPKHIILKVFQIVRTPFYAIAMTFAALFSIFFPYQGRELVAKIEKSWLQFTSKYDDFRYKAKEWKDFVKVMKESLNNRGKTLFIFAWCFQPLEKLRVVKPQIA